jgi:hypothetical protein
MKNKFLKILMDENKYLKILMDEKQIFENIDG